MTNLMTCDPWYYAGSIFDSSTIDDYYGFVYIIENKATGMKYIGKKFFWSSKILPKTKTRKRKKRIKVESDWKTYFGSSDRLKKDVEVLGSDSFTREIIHLCKSKGECSYLEMREQIVRDVLLKPQEYYNAFVGGKIHRKHLGTLLSDSNGV